MWADLINQDKVHRALWCALYLAVTLLLWAYYIFGWLAAFPPFYLYAYLFSRNREEASRRPVVPLTRFTWRRRSLLPATGRPGWQRSCPSPRYR